MAAVNDGYASVPVDGWTQMIIYRKDLFDDAGLAAPTTYANVLAAISALHNPPDRLDEAKTIEALDFYKAIAEASPPGELYWKQSRELS